MKKKKKRNKLAPRDGDMNQRAELSCTLLVLSSFAFLGECHNPTLAGKRRITTQDGETALAVSSPQGSMYASTTAIIIISCSCAIIAFLVIFAFSQVRIPGCIRMGRGGVQEFRDGFISVLSD